ncbi:PepSY domain-containing protein [Altererythrobacter sp. ZODW24]|uniref:PepSY domain-containing protein n=1 Tax=Altererythrobacter sp. ZODW24 TaxID=2185142 RepID=UPI000DF74A8B|nr:PepSY domain-containing protein [Altererythrobacter sp. ZODW24]
MRKWHRWLSVFFGIFLFFIATTGLLSQAADLWPQPELTAAQLAAQEPPAAFVCPDGWNCRPPSTATGIASWKSFFHHIHSGEEFGPVGIAISVLSGFALLFFSFSGLWMYIRMWGNRKERGANGGMFWK